MKEAATMCEHPMYDNLPPLAVNVSFTGVQNTPKPLIQETTDTSNTQPVAITESAHDITVRTR
jgi:hypothetical protein